MVHLYVNNKHFGISKLSFLVLVSLGLFLLMPGCEKKAGEVISENNKSDKTSVLSDKPLTDFQNKLIDIAFDTATAIPINPHVKDRCKMQELVVTTCLKLEQPGRAAGYIEKIVDWRRGECYADLAFYYAQHGDFNNIPKYLEIADEISQTADQDWRKDRIKVRIAQTRVLMGQNHSGENFEKELDNSEKGKIARVQAMVSDNNSFDEQIKTLNEVLKSGVFDAIKNQLESATELFNRFYEDTEKRNLIEEKIKNSWGTLPIFIRIDILDKLTGFAIDHCDKQKAVSLINEIQKMINENPLPVEQRIFYVSKLVRLRCKVEDYEKASIDADGALAFYKEKKDSLLNIERAGALRPLAEAYQVMGDTNAALDIYKMAIEESVVNRNSRPRAEDLTATCCSMALYAVQPDAKLWARIQVIREALDNPW